MNLIIGCTGCSWYVINSFNLSLPCGGNGQYVDIVLLSFHFIFLSPACNARGW